MKTKKSILHILLCAFLYGTTSTVFAQMPNLQWNKSSGGNTCSGPFTNDNYDAAGGFAQTPDGGYIAVSSINSKNGDFSGNHASGSSLSSDVGLVKYNATGNVMWTKLLGGTGYDDGKSIIVTKDGGYFFSAVTTTSNNGDVSGYNGSNDIWIVKTDSSGTIIWQTCLPGSSSETCATGQSVTQLLDSSYIVCGQTSTTSLTGYHGGQSDGYVAHYSKNGSLIGYKCIGGSLTDEFRGVIATSDSGYILNGYTTSTNGDITNSVGSGDIFTVKMTKNDVISWAKSFGTTTQEFGWGIIPNLEGGYYVCGNPKGGITGYKGGLHDGMIIKITSSGSVIWAKPYGGSKDDNIYSLALTPDSGLVFNAITNSNDSNVAGGNYHPTSNDFWVGKVNKNGVLTAQKCYGGNDAELPTCIIVSSDGGYVVFGQTKSSANGDVTSVGHTVTINGVVKSTTELWLFKLYTPPTPHVFGPVPTPVTPAIDRVVADPNLVEETVRKSLPATESNLDVPVQILKVYYNQENLVITKPTNDSEITIYDLSGRIVENFNSLKPGYYIAISVEPDKSFQKCKFIVN